MLVAEGQECVQRRAEFPARGAARFASKHKAAGPGRAVPGLKSWTQDPVLQPTRGDPKGAHLTCLCIGVLRGQTELTNTMELIDTCNKETLGET